MKKTLVILAHNNFEKSLSNKIISKGLEKEDSIKIKNLIELYPDYKISIEDEQKALLEADNIVLQFPFFWYSCPAILKAWIDSVMQYGFAFGSNGGKLVGKNLILSFTTGAPEEVYKNENGLNIINNFLTPFKGFSDMIQTNYINPIISYNMSYIPGIHDKNEIEINAKKHNKKLLERLKNI